MYYYTDPERESDPYTQPDVEVFQSDYWLIEGEHGETVLALDSSDVPTDEDGNIDEDSLIETGNGWFFAFGFIGCLYDSDVFGPYATEDDALASARDMAMGD